MIPARETIFAQSSGAGRAGIAVIRISGPAAGAALTALGCAVPPARRATRARLTDPADGEALDDALVLWFPGPASFTGEDVAELHLHGGRAVIVGAIDALSRLPGTRPAEPGEFTRRAFENGKLDLTAAEGLADLIEAETQAQRRQALRQSEGALAELYESWRQRLTKSLAHFEASIDFTDEDLPAATAQAAVASVAAVDAEINAHLEDDGRGQRLRDGFSVAIVGAPNVGKSSLLNALAQRDVVIVAATAGTTRDIVEVHLDLGGLPVTIADTAGLRELDPAASDPVEAEGIRRALKRAQIADLRIVLFELGDTANQESQAQIDENAIVVVNKIDIVCEKPPGELEGLTALAVSALTGEGIAALLEHLTNEVSRRMMVSGAPTLTRARHRLALEDCREALGRAVAGSPGEANAELIAEDLRLAARALGRITGRVDVEDLLDVIFRDFCIGK
ncbi:MAG: tRNA uridine-5-carboxymethylaminomethyl(34) synthesis GTPase MnmE [Alphaproteobacteria bacterium]